MALGWMNYAGRNHLQLPRRSERSIQPGAHSGGTGGPPRTIKPPTEEHGDDDSRWPGPLLLSLVGAAGLSMLSLPAPQAAQAKDNAIERYVDSVMTTVGPILTTLGFSGFIGLCVGKALKAVSGCLAIAVGALFIGAQLIAHKTGKRLDFSVWEEKGWFEKEEISDGLKAGLRMLTQGVPSVGGFLAGLALGFKW